MLYPNHYHLVIFPSLAFDFPGKRCSHISDRQADKNQNQTRKQTKSGLWRLRVLFPPPLLQYVCEAPWEIIIIANLSTIMFS